MKKFLNINKQRIFAFLFALIIASSTCIVAFSQSVSAEELNTVSDDYSGIWIFNDDPEFLPLGTVISGSFQSALWGSESTTNYYVNLWFADVMGDMQLVYQKSGQIGSGVTAFQNGSWLGYMNIIYVDNNEQSAEFIQYLTANAKRYSHSQQSSLTFKQSLIFNPGLTITGSFVSNGESFIGMSCTNKGYLYYKLPDGSSKAVYHSGAWVNSAYANVKFEGDYTLDSIQAYFFLQDNIVPPPSPLDPITNAFTAVIGWVGTVVSAIVSGELVALRPLVAIGIAVSALLLAWVFIRRSIWGS